MITEPFLNSCFSLILGKHTEPKRDIFRDVLEITVFFSANNKQDIPDIIKNKMECLKNFCELKLENREDDNVIDSVLTSGKFKGLKDFIETKQLETLNSEVIEDHIKQIKIRKRYMSLLPNCNKLSGFLDIAKNGSFESLDKFTNDYELITKEMYTNLMQCGRDELVDKCVSLDLVNDDFGPVTNSIVAKYDRKNSIPTGIPILDDDVLNGGFSRSRLYIFGGASGAGKSTLMMNTFGCQITGQTINGQPCNHILENAKQNETPEIYLYITMENQVDESLLRLYQLLFSKNEVSAIKDMPNVDFVKNEVRKKVRRNVIPIFKYFPKQSISVIDIMTILDDVESKYGKGCIKCLYVDYLDLLKSDIKNSAYHLELGFITSGLKDLAVDYNIPVITGSQLNKSIYNEVDSRSFNLGMVSDSMQKVNHADFISLMTKDRIENIVHLRVGKNRGGVSEVSISFKIDFSMFKFINGFKATVQKKLDQNYDSNDVIKFNGHGQIKI